jgi:hypothetical protein
MTFRSTLVTIKASRYSTHMHVERTAIMNQAPRSNERRVMERMQRDIDASDDIDNDANAQQAEDIERVEETLESLENQLRIMKAKFATNNKRVVNHGKNRLDQRDANQKLLSEKIAWAKRTGRLEKLEEFETLQTLQNKKDAEGDAGIITFARNRTRNQDKAIQDLKDRADEMREKQEMRKNFTRDVPDVPDEFKRSNRTPTSDEKNYKRHKDANVSSPGEIRRQNAYTKGFNNMPLGTSAAPDEIEMHKMGQFERDVKRANSAAPARAATAPVNEEVDDGFDRQDDDYGPNNNSADLIAKVRQPKPKGPPPIYDMLAAQKAILKMKDVMSKLIGSEDRMNAVSRCIQDQVGNSGPGKTYGVITSEFGTPMSITDLAKRFIYVGAIRFGLDMITHASKPLFMAVWNHDDIAVKMRSGGYAQMKADDKKRWFYDNVLFGTSNAAIVAAGKIKPVPYQNPRGTGYNEFAGAPYKPRPPRPPGASPQLSYRFGGRSPVTVPQQAKSRSPRQYQPVAPLGSLDDYTPAYDYTSGSPAKFDDDDFEDDFDEDDLDEPDFDEADFNEKVEDGNSRRSPSGYNNQSSFMVNNEVTRQYHYKAPGSRRSQDRDVPSYERESQDRYVPETDGYPYDTSGRSPSRGLSIQRSPGRGQGTRPLSPELERGPLFAEREWYAAFLHEQVVSKLNRLWGKNEKEEGNLWVFMKHLSYHTYIQMKAIEVYIKKTGYTMKHIGDQTPIQEIYNVALFSIRSAKANSFEIKLSLEQVVANFTGLIFLARAVMSMLKEYPESREKLKSNELYEQYTMESGQKIIDLLSQDGKLSRLSIGGERLMELYTMSKHFDFDIIGEM